jgi:hypothetical protein
MVSCGRRMLRKTSVMIVEIMATTPAVSFRR